MNGQLCNKLSDSDKVYFIRHKEGEDIEKENRKKSIIELMHQKRIAIFFENEPWSKVYDEKSGLPSLGYFHKFTQENSTYRSALNFFHRLSTEGGYIVAEYLGGKVPNGGCGAIVSKILKGTKVEKAEGFEVTLKLDENHYKEFDYYTHPVLLAIRPPYGTICQPSRETYRAFVDYTLFGTPPVLSADLLHPKMVEQMCVEYLRKVGVNGNKLSYCTLRPGKTLAVIDICGVLENNEEFFAQVKNGKIDKYDLAAFEEFTNKNIAGLNVVFSNDPPGKRNNVTFLNIDVIFKYFIDTNKQMLLRMSGFN